MIYDWGHPEGMPTNGGIIFYRAKHSNGMQDIQFLIITLSHLPICKTLPRFGFFMIVPLSTKKIHLLLYIYDKCYNLAAGKNIEHYMILADHIIDSIILLILDELQSE